MTSNEIEQRIYRKNICHLYQNVIHDKQCGSCGKISCKCHWQNNKTQERWLRKIDSTLCMLPYLILLSLYNQRHIFLRNKHLY